MGVQLLGIESRRLVRPTPPSSPRVWAAVAAVALQPVGGGGIHGSTVLASAVSASGWHRRCFCAVPARRGRSRPSSAQQRALPAPEAGGLEIVHDIAEWPALPPHPAAALSRSGTSLADRDRFGRRGRGTRTGTGQVAGLPSCCAACYHGAGNVVGTVPTAAVNIASARTVGAPDTSVAGGDRGRTSLAASDSTSRPKSMDAFNQLSANRPEN